MREPRGQHLDSARPRTAKASRIDWSDAEIVHVVLPRCPGCGCLEWDHVKSMGNGDGTNTQRVVCRQCHEPYKIVREFVADED
jgi:hypothetical protein